MVLWKFSNFQYICLCQVQNKSNQPFHGKTRHFWKVRFSSKIQKNLNSCFFLQKRCKNVQSSKIQKHCTHHFSKRWARCCWNFYSWLFFNCFWKKRKKQVILFLTCLSFLSCVSFIIPHKILEISFNLFVWKSPHGQYKCLRLFQN